jgi:hypothetical protein
VSGVAHAITRGRGAPPATSPRTPVAHELAPGREAEREADALGEAMSARPPVAGWSFAAAPPSAERPAPSDQRPAPSDPRAAAAVSGPGRPLAPDLRHHFEGHLDADLSRVRVHDDHEAAAATRRLGVHGLAHGEDVALASGPHDVAARGMRALLGHELAHVVQQRQAGAAALQLKGDPPVPPASTLDALPEADRKRIQVVTAQISVPGLAEKFATTGTQVTSAFPPGVTTTFDASVDAALNHGLTNVAGSLSAGQELTPAPLRPNSTVTLELDVPSKGKGLYRFTYDAPPAAAATGAATPPPAPRILIEALGTATTVPGTTAPAPASTGAPPAPDPVADKIKNHSLKQSYAGAELDALRAAIAQIPDAQLSVVDGLAFDRQPADANDPTAAGHYDQATHTVTMFDLAFVGTQTRTKGAAATSSAATRAIAHEIGHAIDLAPLRKAGLAKDKADAAVNALPQKYPNPKDPTAFQFKKGTDAEKDVNATLKAQTDAETALTASRSISGTQSVKQPSGDFKDVIGTAAAGNKFREAMAKDGGKAVTVYGDKDFQEAFAEAYSLYITSPSTLKSLRPNVFDVLDKSLPK